MADFGIWSAYFTIPFALIYLVRNRTDLPFAKLFWLFAVFILACGTTHFLDALMFWWPTYRLTGLVELITAIVSWITIFAIIPVIPKALLLKSPAQMETEIQQRTEALQMSEMRFRLLTEGVKDYSIYLEDSQGRITSWNEGAERIYGYKSEEVLGQSITRFLTEEEIQNKLPERKLKIALEHGRFEQEALRVRKGGEHFWANIVITPVYDQAGNHLGFSNISRDITAKKQTEAELEELRSRLSRVIEGTDEGFWDWDISKKSIYWSDRVYEILGLPPSPTGETIESFESYLSAEDLPRIREALKRTQELGIPYAEEFRMRHASGNYVYVYSRGKPEYDAQGNLVHLSGMIGDITQRKNTEVALEKANRQLAQSNRDLEQFAAVASHDLKAPLRKVNLFSGMLESEQENLSKEGQQVLGRVRSAIESMLILIDDLLSWSKIGHANTEIQPVNLDNVLHHTLTILKPSIEEKGAEIQINNLQTVLADEIQLEQLFQNLVENALKYQPPGQKPIIQIDAERFDHAFWQITVQDNGIGFKPEYAERIFEPFARLHGKSSSYPGSGVGLAICKRIVERCGGTIEAQSEEGKGAKFIIRLPYQPSAEHNETTRNHVLSGR